MNTSEMLKFDQLVNESMRLVTVTSVFIRGERVKSRLKWKKTRAGIGKMFHKETLKDFQSSLKSGSLVRVQFSRATNGSRFFASTRKYSAGCSRSSRPGKYLTLGNLSALVDGDVLRQRSSRFSSKKHEKRVKRYSKLGYTAWDIFFPFSTFNDQNSIFAGTCFQTTYFINSIVARCKLYLRKGLLSNFV